MKAELAASQALLAESIARENALKTELAGVNLDLAAANAKITNAKAALA